MFFLSNRHYFFSTTRAWDAFKMCHAWARECGNVSQKLRHSKTHHGAMGSRIINFTVCVSRQLNLKLMQKCALEASHAVTPWIEFLPPLTLAHAHTHTKINFCNKRPLLHGEPLKCRTICIAVRMSVVYAWEIIYIFMYMSQVRVGVYSTVYSRHCFEVLICQKC